jgi:HK97 family phage major capsid protein
MEMDEGKLAEIISKSVSDKMAEIETKKMADREAVTSKANALQQAGAQTTDADVPDSVKLGRVMRAMALAGGDHEKAQFIMDKNFKSFPAPNAVKKMLSSIGETKAQNMATPSEGGFLVNTGYAGFKVDPLLANTILDKLQVTKVDMPNGNLTVRVMTGEDDPSWGNESVNASKVTSAFGQVKLVSKKLDGLVAITNEQLMSDSISTDSWIIDILMKKFQRKVDYTAFYGTGSLLSPAGLDNLLVSTNKTGSSGTATTTNTPLEMIVALESLNVPQDGTWFWGMHPQMWGYLANIKSTTGNFIFRDEMSKGTLFGFPIYKSTNFGYTSTGTYNTSSADIWLGPASELIWGQQQGLEIVTSREASYIDGSTLVSSFSRNETVIRAIQYADFNVKHNNTLLKFTGKFAAS